jgi:trehalose 6-phosphate phosphatase
LTAPPDDRGPLIEAMRGAARLAVLLDYDGTIVPIASTPGAARPDAGLLELLGALAACPAVALAAVVSGRTVANLRELLGALPGLALVGTHGAEIVPSGGGAPVSLFDRSVLEARLDALRREARRLADPARGFLLEDKGLAIAFHYRLAEPAEAARRAAAFERLCDDPLFAPIRGNKVVEVRPRGADKGAAIRALLDRLAPPAPLAFYAGDDVTDEDAFRALGGEGLTAVVAAEPRPTAARYRLADPEAVREVIEAVIGRGKSPRACAGR